MYYVAHTLRWTHLIPQPVVYPERNDLLLENWAHSFNPDFEIGFLLLSFQIYEMKLMLEVFMDDGDYSSCSLNLQGSFLREDAVHSIHYYKVSLFPRWEESNTDSRNVTAGDLHL